MEKRVSYKLARHTQLVLLTATPAIANFELAVERG
jgi:hypothetical protein